MKLKTIGLFLFLMLQVTLLFSSDTISAYQVLQRIWQIQQQDHKDFSPGIFPSYREYAKNRGTYKNDENIFFTGLIAFTLRDLKPYLSVKEQQLADSIINRVQPLFKMFQDPKGSSLYGFWRTDPPEVFPNSGWLNLMNRSHALPLDLDDTAVILLASGASDSTVRSVHEFMQSFVNNNKRKVKNTFKQYKNIPAYSTWFGKRMPIDFDPCVLSNVLYLVQTYQLPFTAADSASVLLLSKIIENGHYETAAAYISPHYGRPQLILYHLSRLMQKKVIPALEVHKNKLIKDAKKYWACSDNIIDKTIMSTTLMRLGAKPPPPDTLHTSSQIDFYSIVENNNFSLFIANMTSMLPNLFKKWGEKSEVGKFYYYCPAYNELLMLENMIWQRRVKL